MKRLSILLLFNFLIAVQQVAVPGGWGRTFAISIDSDQFDAPLVIDDPSIVDSLTFWVGPGTGYSVFMGPHSPELSIVDWDKGEASEKPEGLMRYEVRFLLEPRDNPPVYVIFYEPNPADNSGFIYYPTEANSIVTHGVDGTWRHASSRWNKEVGTAISQHLR